MLKTTKDLESLREELEARGVRFLMASFSDMHGTRPGSTSSGTNGRAIITTSRTGSMRAT